MLRLMLLSGVGASGAMAQVPAVDLAKPPADATHYIIESTGGKHGD